MERDDANMLRYQRAVRQINARESTMRAKSDEELRAATDELKARLTPRICPAKRKAHPMLVPKSGDTPS